jgi:ATP-dependent RNA helicase DeaD
MSESNLRASQIDDIKVLDEFSFATLPVAQAEVLVEFYKKQARGKKPLITMAVSKDDDRARGNNRFGGGARRSSGGFDKPRGGGFEKPRGGFDKPTGNREGGRRERKKF